MGFDDAPIDVLYWSDYLCPYCQAFALDIHSKIVKNEVAEGLARFVFLELPNIAENSWPAAVMAKAVWRTIANDNPNRYWKWHHAVFEHQGEPGSGWASRENLLDITSDVGIDTGAVTAYMDANHKQLEREIVNEISAANQASIPGTPAFYFYNRQTDESKTIIGTQPYARYQAAIDSLLK
jgi:protein-disulfide isomerase